MEQHFPEFLERRIASGGFIQMLGNFLPGIFVPFDFPPRLSGIFGCMVCFSEIKKFPDFL